MAGGPPGLGVVVPLLLLSHAGGHESLVWSALTKVRDVRYLIVCAEGSCETG